MLDKRNAVILTHYIAKGKSKSTFCQRLMCLDELLAANSADDANEKTVVAYEAFRSDLADEYVDRFGMLPDGAKKVAGDTIGNGLHGLQLRKLDEKGVSVVPLRLAAERVALAQQTIAALPENASDKAALAAALAALGLASAAERKAKETADKTAA